MMSAKLKTVVFWLCVLMSVAGFAQKRDSVRLLGDVIVEQSRLNNYATSQYSLPVDSMTLALSSGGSLADMLRKNGYGHMRSYGPGGLASASIRGTGSSHTSVLWNGINLVSPLAGQLDLSLVPVGFIDEASVQSGGAASLYGNGSIGGTIQLNNKAIFNEGLKLKTFANAGSFGSYYQDFGVSWSGKNFITSTKVFTSQAKNDFEFTNRNYFPPTTERRDHTAVDQKGILQQNYWHVNSNNLLTLKFWYQDNFYEIPNPSSVPRKSEATEKNVFYRTVAGWNYSRDALDLNYQGAFIHHELNYLDPVTSLVSPSAFDTFINNLEGNLSLKKAASITAGSNYTWEQGKVDAFGDAVPVRNRVALFGAFKWKPATRWELVTSFREEIVNGNTTPAAPSLTAKVNTGKGVELYGTFSRSYRLPTFNDLYWKGAGGLGNPDLRPEVSMGGEAGMRFNSTPASADAAVFSFKTALFSNHVDNWILWIPLTSAVWTPKNIKKVWSRGIETQASASKKVRKIVFELQAHYSFTQATNEGLYEGSNPNELDKQLMLTPLHEASATARITWKGFHINIAYIFTGKQYTDSDNSEFLAMKPYHLTNLGIGKPFVTRNIKATLSGELNNIFGTEYQSRPGYPMPGRNFKLGLTLNFIKPNSL